MLLILYLALTVVLFYAYRADFRHFSSRQRNWTSGLAVLALIAGLMFPLDLFPDLPANLPVAALTLVALIPALLAAAFLPITAVFLIGISGGLGMMLAQSQSWLVLFNVGFTAVFAALLMQQRYRGQLYRWLRQPVVAGILTAFLFTLLSGLTTFAAADAPWLTALDQTLVVMRANLAVYLIEAVIAGLVVMGILRAVPDLQTKRPLTPSPDQRSLQRQLISHYALFSVVMISLTIAVVYLLITFSTSLTLLKQMDASANNIAAEMALKELDPTAPNTEAQVSGYFKRAPNHNTFITSTTEDSGYMVDKEGRVATLSGDEELLSYAEPLPAIGQTDISGYRAWLADGSRALVVTSAVPGQLWTVAAVEPYSVVLRQAVVVIVPLLLVLMASAVLFTYAGVKNLERQVTEPLSELVTAANTMSNGDNWSTTQQVEREDEIGDLNRAFVQMQRATRKQLNELSLLLSVSQAIATTIDISQGLPEVLRGAVRGTGAAGARAVVLNPSGGRPLTFGEGTASAEMAALDRTLMGKLRQTPELILSTPEEIQTSLELDKTPPVPSLLAVQLRSHDRFQGILWLGYRHAHSYDEKEWQLLKTMAGQTAVLVENARLYATAEGGRRRLAAVLASTSDAVVVTDHTERILLINRSAEQIFGLNAAEAVGRPVTNVLQDQALLDALTGKSGQMGNVEVSTGNGRVYYANASTIVSNEGQVFGRVAVLRDITMLKEIDQMKSDFVATVSHDLRSPLTFMRGYTTMLPMVGELTDKQQEYIEKILAGIDQMTQMVDDLLDLGRIEAGVDLEYESFEIKPLLTEIAEEYWQHAHLAGLKIQVETAPESIIVTGDRALIRQAITNLTGNALKYAPNSGSLILRAELREEKLVLSVEDHGPGIPKQDQYRLFEKFYRIKQRGTERVKGSGLGLAIVKSIAERHDGRVWCTSQPGKGTTFFIGIPNTPSREQSGQNGSA
ncbi:MAG TPA: PAS domain S-box protein [Anaerolineae bacterium]|nr:PAS domain S-box protein [Anaerolineae bacterium]